MHIRVEDLAFGFPGHQVLSGVKFKVSTGARLGLVGENGSGKTTLLRLLAGELAATSGVVEVSGSFEYIAQELEFEADQTVGDLKAKALYEVHQLVQEIEVRCDAFDHTTGNLGDLTSLLERGEHLALWDAPRRVEVALSRLGACTDPDRKLATLSVGERFRVRLACALAQRSEVLLLDEPTNHLDQAGIHYLTQELMSWRGVVVFVTHDRMLLDDVATAILDLDPSMDGVPVLYGQPGYLSYRFAKSEHVRRWTQRYRAERKRAQLLEHRLDRSYEGLSDEWRPPKGSQKHRRQTGARIHVKAADRLVEQLKAQAVDIPVPPPIFRFPDLPAQSAQWPAHTDLLDLRNVRVGPKDRPRIDLPGQRLTLGPSGRLLVVGANGSGKSTLLSLMVGLIKPDRGYVSTQEGLRMGVLLQEGSLLPTQIDLTDPLASAFDQYGKLAVRLLEQGLLDPEHVVALMDLGLMAEADLDRPVAQLSVGQRRRFDLACALLAAPHLLILDEPTNHLSIDLVDHLTQGLRNTPAAVVVATHDRKMQEELGDWPVLDLTGAGPQT